MTHASTRYCGLFANNERGRIVADTCNSALGRLRQEDCKLEGSLVDIVRFYLNTKTEHRRFKSQISTIQAATEP